MTLQQLRVFVLAVRLQKLYLVAEELGISQPTVTFHLNRLQQEMGVPLFKTASFRVLKLTYAGEALLHYARNITAMTHEVGAVMTQFKQLRGGRVSVGCTYTPATYMLPPLLARMKKEYPQLSVALEVAPALVVAEKVKRFELDLGLVSEVGLEDAELVKERLLREDLLLAFHPAHALAQVEQVRLQDLAMHAYVSHEVGSLSRSLIDEWAARHDLRLDIALEVSQTEAMKEAVRCGIGFAMISSTCVERDVREGMLVTRPIPAWPYRRYISIVRRADKLTSPAMGLLLGYLAEYAEPDVL